MWSVWIRELQRSLCLLESLFWILKIRPSIRKLTSNTYGINKNWQDMQFVCLSFSINNFPFRFPSAAFVLTVTNYTIFLYLTLLTLRGTEPFLRSCKLCSCSRTFQHFMEPEISLSCSQRVLHWSLSEARSVQFIPPHFISVRFTLIL
jgi:hypothetical protein